MPTQIVVNKKNQQPPLNRPGTGVYFPQKVKAKGEWLVPLLPLGWGSIRITTPTLSRNYLVEKIKEVNGKVLGFKLHRDDGKENYSVMLDYEVRRWICDCPDSIRRQQETTLPELLDCKHSLALRNAIQNLIRK